MDKLAKFLEIAINLIGYAGIFYAGAQYSLNSSYILILVCSLLATRVNVTFTAK